jgi:pimeloyl-ACP methyl ester carboxylesterase
MVVVNWDQRGTGKTYATTARDPLSIEQIVADTHELVVYLKERFGVEKIYVMGFSWGTVPGLLVVDRYPEDFYAYLSLSQIVDGLEQERLSLEYVRQVARETDNQKALAELDTIDPAYQSADWYSQLTTQRKWLTRFGGVYHTRTTYSHEAMMLLKASEYSLVDFAFWPLGSSHSLKQVWPELMQLDFVETVPKVQIPVYFFVGRHDSNTPSALIEGYFDQLDAPAGKKLTWFEESAHSILFDEPEKLTQEIIRIVKEQEHTKTR